MRPLDRRQTPDEAQIMLLLLSQTVLLRQYAVMDGAHLRHGFHGSLKVADRHIVDIRVELIELTETLLVRMMHGVNKWQINQPGGRESWSVIQMDDVAIGSGVSDCP